MKEGKLLNEICRVYRILGNLFALKTLRAISKEAEEGISLADLMERFGREGNIDQLVFVFVSAGLVEEVRQGKNKKRLRITGLGRLFAEELLIWVKEAKDLRS